MANCLEKKHNVRVTNNDFKISETCICIPTLDLGRKLKFPFPHLRIGNNKNDNKLAHIVVRVTCREPNAMTGMSVSTQGFAAALICP